jgi:fatty-acyl-CoA synthase
MTDPTVQTVHTRLAWHAKRRPDHIAIRCEDREVTYAELHRESNQTAHALLAAGLRPGTRVAYLGRESEHYYAIALACAKAAVVLVPINWRLTSREVDHVLRDSGAELMFVENELRSTVDRVRSDLPWLKTVISMDSAESRRGIGFLAWKNGFPTTDL